MAVGVGSFCDPPEMQGLSHYLEHMLFMGSDKFPDENEYDSFLSKHGGSSNAFTELVSSTISSTVCLHRAGEQYKEQYSSCNGGGGCDCAAVQLMCMCLLSVHFYWHGCFLVRLSLRTAHQLAWLLIH
jgi:hypothetical protein